MQNKVKLIAYILICVVIVFACSIIPFNIWRNMDIESRGITSIRGNSMTPTIKNNDILFVQPTKFERGEIVVARCPSSKEYSAATNIALLKRIVGLPGETIELTKDGVLINGKLLEEEYTNNVEFTFQKSNDVNEIILSDNEYFLIGDNRENSFDSRHVGAVHASNFLYGLTLKPNDYTMTLYFWFGIAIFANLLAIVVLPILFFLILTHQPKAIRLKKHIDVDTVPMANINKSVKNNPIKSGKKHKNKKPTSTKVKMASKAKLKQARNKKKRR
jgi:signal peptidase I